MLVHQLKIFYSRSFKFGPCPPIDRFTQLERVLLHYFIAGELSTAGDPQFSVVDEREATHTSHKVYIG